jgi:hypothetical protein
MKLRRIMVAAVLIFMVATPAQALGECTDFLSGCATTESDGIGWYYSAQERAFFQTPGSFQPGSDKPNLEWAYVPACDGNDPDSTTSGLCTGALCTAPTGDPGVLFWQFSRRLNPPGGAWELKGSQCLAGERRVDLADVEAEVRRVVEERFREIAEPSIDMAPASGALVNLPVLAWTADRGDVTLDITQPLPGRITATPQYAWEWSNGVTASGPGRPYSPDLSPTTNPGSYVSSTYDRPGQARVTLTVRWNGQVSVPGVPPVDIDALVYTSSASVAVREARSVLVDPQR